ncbi:unnamed protein product [Gongylonema pulchrum]|uniref:DB domain-containing protein n=1 Tax=Gongylonema pulchrum TaxID=637853 RepID=A0A183E3N7_9BILA|nr:unnamed protein product [Gongylonema pulchrum]
MAVLLPASVKAMPCNDNRQQPNQRRIIIRPDKDLQRPSSSRSSKGWKPSTFLNRIHQNGSRQRGRTREQQQPQPQGQDYLQQHQEHQQRQRQREEYQQQQRQEYRQPQEEYQQQQQQQQRQEQQRYQQEQEQRRYRERERIREEQRAELEKQRQQQEEQRRIQEQRRLLDEQRRLQEQQQQQQQQEQQRRIQEQQRRIQQERKTEDELYTDDTAEPAEEQWRPLESPGQQTVQQGLFYYSAYRNYRGSTTRAPFSLGGPVKTPSLYDSAEESDYDYSQPVTEMTTTTTQRTQIPGTEEPGVWPTPFSFEQQVPCAAFTDEVCLQQKKAMGNDKMNKCCNKGIYLTDMCMPGRCTNVTTELCCMQKFMQVNLNPEIKTGEGVGRLVPVVQ